ncbi:hypothetical protein STVA_38670 [Allostella vacuolata]|nr:hypothetical protein STVA_38670 [Stella vacuolata]
MASGKGGNACGKAGSVQHSPSAAMANAAKRRRNEPCIDQPSAGRCRNSGNRLRGQAYAARSAGVHSTTAGPRKRGNFLQAGQNRGPRGGDHRARRPITGRDRRQEPNMIKTALFAAILAVSFAGTALASMDDGKFGANMDEGKYGRFMDDGKFGANADEGKFGANADEGKFGANADEGKAGRNMDEGKLGANGADGA